MESEFYTLVQYLAMERYSQQMETACLGAIESEGSYPVFYLWKAVSLLFQERIPECIQELEGIREKKDVNLCTLFALRDAHKKAKLVDKDTIAQIESSIKSVRQSCTDRALYNAAMYLWLNGRHEKSREYVDRMLKLSPKSKDGILLRGWIDLTCNKDAYIKKSIKYFEDVLTSGGDQYVGGSLGALIGKSRYLTLKNNFSNALDVISEAVVTFPKSTPALIEKARLQVMLREWESAMETCQRILALEQECIEAIHLKALYQLAIEGQHYTAVETIGDLIQVIDKKEPQNHTLYYQLSLSLCRVCGRSPAVVSQTLALVERACSLRGNNPVFTTELGYQLLLQGKINDALKIYKKAFSFDDTSVAALAGAIHCQILLGRLDEAKQQLDFLEEVQATIGKSAEVSYLSAILAIKQNRGTDAILSLLDETAQLHFQAVRDVPLGAQYFVLLNPDFILQIVNDLMSFSPTDSLLPSQEPSRVLRSTSFLLSPVCSSAPGIASAWLMQARVSYLSGEPDKALAHLDTCFIRSGDSLPGATPGASEAHVLAAQIHISAGDYTQASVSLDQALSLSFDIRDNPHYQLIKAQVSRRLRDMEEALRCLNLAISLTGIAIEDGQGGKKVTKGTHSIGIQEKASIYLEYAEVLSEMGDKEKAERTMKEAKRLFTGSPAEARVQLAEADIHTRSGDIDSALKILGAITVSQPCFVEAARSMADIYLDNRKDKKLFIQTHKDLASKVPQSYVTLLLGDAYMKVQNPEKAIEVYESVLKKNPKDANLSRKIGHVLVVTHNYSKAINYYETALKNQKEPQLLHDLAELYFKLKNYDKAIRVLTEALNEHKQHKVPDLSSSIEESSLLVLLARVHANTGQQDEALNVWRQAHQHQQKLVERVKVEKPELVSQQKQTAASVCFELGQIYSQDMLDWNSGTRYYKESLYFDENSVKVRLALAGSLLSNGDLEGCQQQCSAVLRQEEDNETATLMLAQLMLKRGEVHSAIAHLNEVLERKPNNYLVLVTLLDFLRRAGKIKDAGELLEKAEKTSSRAVYDPGMSYCMGVFKWHTHCPNDALELLNKARRDPTWGDRATVQMVSICINPDGRVIGGDTLEDSSSLTEKQHEVDMKGVATAEKLLREMKPKSHEMRVRRDILNNLILIYSRTRGSVDKAVSNLSEMISLEKDHVGVLTACATGLMVLKQVPRARNHLKRVSKLPWTYETAEDYEQAMLLLADIYIQNGKFDYSNELLKRALEYDKSCSKAWEYLGFVSEKEQAYKDASECYEKAWTHGNQTNPTIGYKLAFNYLKAKRHVDAVDICHKVLNLYPNYPKIRKEILDKARSSLRI